MAALKLAASFLPNQNPSSPSPPPPSARPHPITPSSPHPVHPARLRSPEHVQSRMASGPVKPLTLLPYPGNSQTPPPPGFRLHKHQHQQLDHISFLPSPPLSSVEPPYSAGLKSPLQERCEALENELAALRLRLKSEQSPTMMEDHYSCFQQSDVQPSQETKRELRETNPFDQELQLKMPFDPEPSIQESRGRYPEITDQQRRLEDSTDKVEKLQRENQELIEQLRGLRAKVAEVSSAVESADLEENEKYPTDSELDTQSAKYKTEIERLQGLVLIMGNRHVQVQAQLAFFQQQAQQLQEQLDQSRETPLSDVAQVASLPQSPGTPGSRHGSMMMEGSTLSSLLTSVASVASASPSRRTKITRRFTVNAPRKDGELTMEQRKCEFLMDQISVLQRGYDVLRQEKVTLELQLDLLQRQHQYHQQQRQKRRDSQSRGSGKEPKPLAIITVTPKSVANTLSAIPSTPLLPSISAAEREREKARIQHELEQAQIRAQKEAKVKEAQRLAAQAAAEEAEREAIRLKRAKSLHLKETLASLEAKRSDSRHVQFTNSDELKHLEHLRHLNEQQQKDRSSGVFAAARISRWIASPFSSSSSLHSQLSSTPTSPSPLSTTASPSPSSSTYSPQTKQPVHYTHSAKQQRTAGLPHGRYTIDIEHCSCCLGTMIDI